MWADVRIVYLDDCAVVQIFKEKMLGVEARGQRLKFEETLGLILKSCNVF